MTGVHNHGRKWKILGTFYSSSIVESNHHKSMQTVTLIISYIFLILFCIPFLNKNCTEFYSELPGEVTGSFTTYLEELWKQNFY